MVVVPKVDVEIASSDFLSEFSTAELMEGVDLYCQIKLNCPTQAFFDRVHAGEKFEPATQEIADIVRLIDKRVDDERNRKAVQEADKAKLQGNEKGTLESQDAG